MKYWTGKPHVLVISRYEDDEGEYAEYEVQHRSDCPVREMGFASEGALDMTWEEFDCDVGVHLHEVGLDFDWQELEEGEYVLNAWHEQFTNGEFDGGLILGDRIVKGTLLIGDRDELD